MLVVWVLFCLPVSWYSDYSHEVERKTKHYRHCNDESVGHFYEDYGSSYPSSARLLALFSVETFTISNINNDELPRLSHRSLIN